MGKKLKTLYKSATASIAIFLLMPVAALAAPPTGVVTPNYGLKGTSSKITAYINSILTYIVTITAIIAVLCIIYGGIMYMLAAGDEKRAAKAKNIILYALIGVAAIVGAWLLITFITNFLNNGGL